MAEILLISEKYIKENCEISDNVSGKFILSAIQEAQDLKLTPVLGEALVDKLKELVSNKTIGNAGNAAYKFLLDNSELYPELTENHKHQIKANLLSAASSNICLGGARGK